MFLASLLQFFGLISLHTAAQQADVPKMRQLIEQHANVNASDRKGATPLFYTANLGSVEGAQLLLEHGADINATVPGGGTPLHSALLKKHQALSLFLIERGADVNRTTQAGVTPLHMAVLNAMPTVVEQLLKRGADPKALTKNEQSPMILALQVVAQEQPDAGATLRLLLDAGAMPDKAWIDLLYAKLPTEKANAFAQTLIEAAGAEHARLRNMVESVINAQAVAALGGSVHSPLLGTMQQSEEEHLSEWWYGEPVAVPFWDGAKIPVVYTFNPVEDPDFIREADAAMSAFLQKTAQDRLALTPLLRENCEAYCANVSVTEEDVKTWLGPESGAGLWGAVALPEEIFVERRRRRDKDVYVWMPMSCQWMDLLFVYRQGRQLTRLSSPDGWLTDADAFATEDADDEMLSKFSATD